MHFSLRRKLAIGATALAAAAFAGGAYAANQDSAGTSRQAFLNDVAKRLNVSPQQLTAAIRGAWLDRLNAAVAAGKITQAQANALKQGGPVPFGPFPRFAPGGFAPRGFGPPGFGRGFGPVFAGPGVIPAAASYLGLTEGQLVQQLSSGKSLAQIAQSKGKTTAGLKSAITAGLRAKLDKARSAGAITAAQEDRLLSNLSSRLDQQINAKGFGPRLYFRGRGQGRLGVPGGPNPPPLPEVPGGPGGGAGALPGPPGPPNTTGYPQSNGPGAGAFS